MRLLGLVACVCLGICLAYARYMQPQAAAVDTYDGPATFVSCTCESDHPDGAAASTATSALPANWLLVCRIDDSRIAFLASDTLMRNTVDRLHPGDAVRLQFDLPSTPTPDGAVLGPPTLRSIAIDDRADAVSTRVPAVASAVAARISLPD